MRHSRAVAAFLYVSNEIIQVKPVLLAVVVLLNISVSNLSYIRQVNNAPKAAIGFHGDYRRSSKDYLSSAALTAFSSQSSVPSWRGV